MKVAIINSSYSPSLVNFRGDLISEFISLGYSVYCTGPECNISLVSSLEELGAKFVKSPISRNGNSIFNDFKYFFFLVRLYLTLRPDVIVNYTIKPVIYGSVAGLLTNVKKRISLVTGLGLAFSKVRGDSYSNITRAIAKRLFIIGLRSSTNIFFQNKDDYSMVVKDKSLSIKSSITFGSGVNTDRFPFKPSNKGKHKTILMVSRIIKEKGVIEYIDAASLIKPIFPEVKFKLIGWSDDLNSKLSRYVKEAHEKGVVEFLGKKDCVLPYLHECDLFVLPSFYPEGVPRVLLEALSVGRPIITTDSVGCRETVREHINGYLVAPQNSMDLFLKIKMILDNPMIINEFGLESRKIALDLFCVHKVNRQILDEAGIL